MSNRLEDFIDHIRHRWEEAQKTVSENIDKEIKAATAPKDVPPDVRTGWLTKTDRITRVEVIDEKGRSYINWRKDNKVKVAFQDEGRTLKIFINTIK